MKSTTKPLLAISALAGFCSLAQAQISWVEGNDGNWTDTANWVGGVAPVSGDSVDLKAGAGDDIQLDTTFAIQSGQSMVQAAGEFILISSSDLTLETGGSMDIAFMRPRFSSGGQFTIEAGASLDTDNYGLGSTSATITFEADAAGVTTWNNPGQFQIGGDNLVVDLTSYDISNGTTLILVNLGASGSTSGQTFASVTLTAGWTADIDYVTDDQIRLTNLVSLPPAATLTWDGSTNTIWTGPSDTTSWSGDIYNDGDFVSFLGAGAGTVTVSGTVEPGSLTVNSAVDYTFSGGVIGGSTGLTKDGPGTLTLTGANSYTGATAVNAGTLEIGGSGTLGSGTYAGATTIATGATLKYSSSAAQTLDSLNTAGTLLVDAGGGTLNLSAATSNVVNVIDLRSGTLNSPRLTLANQFTMSGGTFAQTFQRFRLIDPSGYADSSMTGGTASFTFFEFFSGTGVFTLDGGDLTLTDGAGLLMNKSDSTGTFNLESGTLTLQEIAQQTAGGTTTFNFGGGTLRAGADNSTFMTGLDASNVLAGGALVDTQTFDITIGQDLLEDAVSTGGGLTKTGTGTLTLSGTNMYTGNTTVSEGCLSLDNTGAIPDLTKVNVASGAGFGGIVGVSNLSDTDIASIAADTNWDAGGGSFLVIDTNGVDVEVAADIAGDFGLLKKGDGELTLSGTNTFTGPTVVEGGSIAGSDTEIVISSIAHTGTSATLTFTSSGNVDVYRSTDLQSWGTAFATDEPSPYTDSTATGPEHFYILVPTGEALPLP